MTWWIVGGVLLALFVIGMLSSRADRANAAGKLEEARAAAERGEIAAALALLAKAFWVPASDRYQADDARTSLAALELAEELVRKLGVDPIELTVIAKAELKLASANGGTIEASITKPIARFLDGDKDGWLKNALARKASPPAPRPAPPPSEDPILDEQQQTQVINKVGRALLFNNLDEALAILDAHLPRARDRFRATLLDQRGGCHSMKRDLAAACADYEEAAALEPDASVHLANLAETYERIGRSDDALGAARRALAVGKSDSDRKTAEAVIRRRTA